VTTHATVSPDGHQDRRALLPRRSPTVRIRTRFRSRSERKPSPSKAPTLLWHWVSAGQVENVFCGHPISCSCCRSMPRQPTCVHSPLSIFLFLCHPLLFARDWFRFCDAANAALANDRTRVRQRNQEVKPLATLLNCWIDGVPSGTIGEQSEDIVCYEPRLRCKAVKEGAFVSSRYFGWSVPHQLQQRWRYRKMSGHVRILLGDFLKAGPKLLIPG
jgi:hypothetical protein